MEKYLGVVDFMTVLQWVMAQSAPQSQADHASLNALFDAHSHLREVTVGDMLSKSKSLLAMT